MPRAVLPVDAASSRRSVPARSAARVRSAVVAVYAAVATLHLWVASASRGPVWTDDEIGPIATARLFAGTNPPLDLAHDSYYPGWALLLTPVWWVTSDPATVYRVAVVLSALCATALVAPLAAVARRWGLGPLAATGVGALVAVAPGRSVFSAYALIENCLVLVVAITLVMALRYAESATVGRAAALGAAGGAVFVVHGRMVAVVGMTALWFALDVVRSRRRPGATGLVVTIAVAGAGYLLHMHASSVLYGDATGREASALGSLLAGDAVSVLRAFGGQVWYAAAAWFLLPLFGVVLLVRRCVDEVRRRDVGLGWWAAGVVVGTGAISVLMVSGAIARGSGRLDILTYGRYIEPLLVMLATAGAAEVASRARLSRRVVGAVVATGALLALWLVPSGTALVRDDSWWAPINVAGLLGFAPWGQTAPPWLAASVAMVVVGGALLLAASRRGARRVVLAAVAAALAVGSCVAQVASVRPFNSGLAVPPPVVGVLDDLAVSEISYDTADADWVGQNSLQFWLAGQVQVLVFDSRLEAPPTDLVVSRAQWRVGMAAGAVRVSSTSRDEALWVMPGPLADELVARGAVQPLQVSEPLDDFAVSVDADPVGGHPVSATATTSIDVVLTNEGGTTWAPLGAAPTTAVGVVRVVVWWPVGEDRQPQISDLVHAVVPGGDIEIDLVLDPPEGVTEGDVDVTLIQEGVGELVPASGGPLLSYPID